MNKPALSTKHALVIGAGQIGEAIALKAASHGYAVSLHALTNEQAQTAANRVRAAGGMVRTVAHGDLASGTSDVLVDDTRIYEADVLGSLSRSLNQMRHPRAESPVGPLIERVRPSIVFDGTNMATTLGMRQPMDWALAAAPDVGEAAGYGFAFNSISRYTCAMVDASEHVGVRTIVKIGTTALGGMGIDVPFTHGDSPSTFLSPDIWSKLMLSGAQLQLLWALSRGTSCRIRALIPAACVGFEEIVWQTHIDDETGSTVRFPVVLALVFHADLVTCGVK